MKNKITQHELKLKLSYNYKTGIFKRFSKKSVKKTVGTKTKYGYLRININRMFYQAHILAWLYHYNFHPNHGT